MLGCPVSWETIDGAKPAKSAPTNAATRDATMCRDRTWYQAAAVAAGARVSRIAAETAGPNASVTGASGRAMTRIEVFAMRLTPYGALTSVVNSGFSPWV